MRNSICFIFLRVSKSYYNIAMSRHFFKKSVIVWFSANRFFFFVKIWHNNYCIGILWRIKNYKWWLLRITCDGGLGRYETSKHKTRTRTNKTTFVHTPHIRPSQNYKSYYWKLSVLHLTHLPCSNWLSFSSRIWITFYKKKF